MEPPTVELTEDALIEILLTLDIPVIVKLLSWNADLKSTLSKPYFLNRMSIIHNLPYSKTFDHLLAYSKLSHVDLMKLTVENEGTRITECESAKMMSPHADALTAEGRSRNYSIDDSLELMDCSDNYNMAITYDDYIQYDLANRMPVFESRTLQ